MMFLEETDCVVTSSLDGLISFIDTNKQLVVRCYYGHVSTTGVPIGKVEESVSGEERSAKPSGGRGNKRPEPSMASTTAGTAASSVHSTSYRGHGVVSFDFSRTGKYICSASERRLLLWDPFTLESIYTIDQLSSPVLKVIIRDEVEAIFVTTTDKILRLYHNITYEELQTIADKTYYRPENVLSCCYYVAPYKTFYSGGNRLTSWALERYGVSRTRLKP